VRGNGNAVGLGQVFAAQNEQRAPSTLRLTQDMPNLLPYGEGTNSSYGCKITFV